MFVLLLLIVHLAFTFVSYFGISQYIKILFVLLFYFNLFYIYVSITKPNFLFHSHVSKAFVFLQNF